MAKLGEFRCDAAFDLLDCWTGADAQAADVCFASRLDLRRDLGWQLIVVGAGGGRQPKPGGAGRDSQKFSKHEVIPNRFATYMLRCSMDHLQNWGDGTQSRQKTTGSQTLRLSGTGLGGFSRLLNEETLAVIRSALPARA